jgi:hypothetical protein
MSLLLFIFPSLVVLPHMVVFGTAHNIRFISLRFREEEVKKKSRRSQEEEEKNARRERERGEKRRKKICVFFAACGIFPLPLSSRRSLWLRNISFFFAGDNLFSSLTGLHISLFIIRKTQKERAQYHTRVYIYITHTHAHTLLRTQTLYIHFLCIKKLPPHTRLFLLHVHANVLFGASEPISDHHGRTQI